MTVVVTGLHGAIEQEGRRRSTEVQVSSFVSQSHVGWEDKRGVSRVMPLKRQRAVTKLLPCYKV